MDRRTFLAGCLSAPALIAAARPQQAAPRLATVSVDLAAPSGRFPFGLGRQLSAIPQSWRYGPATLAALDALQLERIRVWLRFTRTVDPATRRPDYARWYDYLDTYHQRAQRVLVNWQTDYDPLVTSGGWTAEQLYTAQVDMLAHYKRRYPKIEYIEVENEDLGVPADAPRYYEKYRLAYRVVNAVNAMNLPGPRLLVGGPTLDVFSTLRLGAFLDQYARDGDQAKRLDFISYHQYLINTGGGAWDALKDEPAIVRTERQQVVDLLRARGLPAVPVLVTEIGVFPGTRESPRGFAADLHIQAACAASLHYHYAGQQDIIPFDWTIDHPENDRKDLFVDLATGVPRPYYAALRQLTTLPPTRVRATSDALSPQGTGVYGLAAASGSTVAVMTWNYQWTGTAAYDSRIVLTGFSGAFRTSSVRVTRYRVAHDVHAGGLNPVETFVIPPRTNGTYYSQTLPLAPNELRLLVLEPTRAP